MSAAFLGYEARRTVACKLVWPIYISLYSYFEKGCRKKARDNPDRYCGWFEFLFLQRNLEELQERLWTYVCEC